MVVIFFHGVSHGHQVTLTATGWGVSEDFATKGGRGDATRAGARGNFPCRSRTASGRARVLARRRDRPRPRRRATTTVVRGAAGASGARGSAAAPSATHGGRRRSPDRRDAALRPRRAPLRGAHLDADFVRLLVRLLEDEIHHLSDLVGRHDCTSVDVSQMHEPRGGAGGVGVGSLV